MTLGNHGGIILSEKYYVTTIRNANCILGGQKQAENSGQRATGAAEERALLCDAVQTRQVNATSSNLTENTKSILITSIMIQKYCRI